MTKWDIEGFTEAVAAEVAPFGIGITIVEPGGARTEFRYGSAQAAPPIAAYDDTPAHGFVSMNPGSLVSAMGVSRLAASSSRS